VTHPRACLRCAAASLPVNVEPLDWQGVWAWNEAVHNQERFLSQGWVPLRLPKPFQLKYVFFLCVCVCRRIIIVCLPVCFLIIRALALA
jgi:hypothetical protein